MVGTLKRKMLTLDSHVSSKSKQIFYLKIVMTNNEDDIHENNKNEKLSKL